MIHLDLSLIDADSDLFNTKITQNDSLIVARAYPCNTTKVDFKTLEINAKIIHIALQNRGNPIKYLFIVVMPRVYKERSKIKNIC